jgi:hypothetical protein
MIDSTSSSEGANRAGAEPEGNGKRATPERAGGKRDRRSAAAERPRKALSREPEIRPEVVARGRKLAADPDYPSASVIQRVAAMIVNSPDLSGGNRGSGR